MNTCFTSAPKVCILLSVFSSVFQFRAREHAHKTCSWKYIEIMTVIQAEVNGKGRDF